MQLDDLRGFPAAGDTGLDHDTVGNFAGTAKTLHERKPVIPPESSNRRARCCFKCKRRVIRYRIAQLLQLSIDPIRS